MRSVCFKEKLDITSETLTDIITSANNDVRLILNHLSMLAADKSDLEASQKYVKLVRYFVKFFNKVYFAKGNVLHLYSIQRNRLLFFILNVN